MLSQKEAVYNAVQSVHTFEDGSSFSLSSEEKLQVIEIVTAGFQSGEVSMSEAAHEKYIGSGDDKALFTYTRSLVDNWLRKDTRMNGGVKYETKNPGSRAGSGDDTIKNLKALRSTLTDAEQIATIDEAISQRQAELKAERAPKVEVDYDHIPDDVKQALGL